jgi:hypothetical protein
MSMIGPNAGRCQVRGAIVLVAAIAAAAIGAGAMGAAACATTTETAQLHIVPAVILDSGPMAIESDDAAAFAAGDFSGDGGRCVDADEARRRAAAGRMAETFDQGSGLLRLHFPSSFNPIPDSDTFTLLSATEESGVNPRSIVTVMTHPEPASQDPVEYARTVQDGRARSLAGYALLSTRPSCCFRDVRGVETRWKYREEEDEGPFEMQARACMFVKNGHGFSLMYSFDPKRPSDEAKLKAIIDAVEMVSPDDNGADDMRHERADEPDEMTPARPASSSAASGGGALRRPRPSSSAPNQAPHRRP